MYKRTTSKPSRSQRKCLEGEAAAKKAAIRAPYETRVRLLLPQAMSAWIDIGYERQERVELGRWLTGTTRTAVLLHSYFEGCHTLKFWLDTQGRVFRTSLFNDFDERYMPTRLDRAWKLETASAADLCRVHSALELIIRRQDERAVQPSADSNL